MKYYVQSGTLRDITDADNPIEAFKKAMGRVNKASVTLSGSVIINERGYVDEANINDLDVIGHEYKTYPTIELIGLLRGWHQRHDQDPNNAVNDEDFYDDTDTEEDWLDGGF